MGEFYHYYIIIIIIVNNDNMNRNNNMVQHYDLSFLNFMIRCFSFTFVTVNKE